MANPSASSPARRWRLRAWAIGGITIALVVGIAIPLLMSGDDASPVAAVGQVPRFVDDTAESGVVQVYDGEFEHFVGGGVAVFDCDDDRRPDLFVAGGSEPAGLFRNASEVGGELRFTEVSSPTTDLTAVTGAYPLDIDSDHVVDLVVLRRGANVVLRGVGNCRFEAANDELGLDGGDDWTAAFSATWEGMNGLPTMAFGNYLASERGERSECADHLFVRPGNDGYLPPIMLAPGYCTLSMLFSDWSRSGRRDLRIANDRHYYTDGTEQLWRIEPDTPPRLYTESDGWRPLQIWGMGIASEDLTGDGYPEVFLTSQGDNKLQALDGDPTAPTYRDIALRRGVTAQRPFVGGDVLPSTAWHPEFDDVNNDGFVDLFVSKGNVEAQPDHASRDPSNLLIGQPDGTFVEGALEAGLVDFVGARGAALADLNLDGLLDLVVVHRRENVAVWRNVGAGTAEEPVRLGSWIAIGLEQPAPNVEAIGSWIEVRIDDRTISREVTVGGGHVGGQLGWTHVGLGEEDGAEIRVQWPDGEFGPWMQVDADRFVTIERTATEATEWSPADR